MLPQGVTLTSLVAWTDARGLIAEFDRRSWHVRDDGPVQWNVVSSGANALRGLHVHLRHVDWVMVVVGDLVVGLLDVRAGAPRVSHMVCCTDSSA
jgi:dTDP-4-dehydrorhamnose 3,5-epimerase